MRAFPIRELAPPLRRAIVLAGDLIELGHLAAPLYAVPGVPASSRERAASLRGIVRPGRTVVLASAAWIHGADDCPDDPQLVVEPRRSRHDPYEIGAWALAARDVEIVAGVPVTTPARTLVDLVRTRFWPLREAVAFARTARVTAADVAAFRPADARHPGARLLDRSVRMLSCAIALDAASRARAHRLAEDGLALAGRLLDEGAPARAAVERAAAAFDAALREQAADAGGGRPRGARRVERSTDSFSRDLAPILSAEPSGHRLSRQELR